ncbi:Delta(8)-fatty-acid desaturase [Capsicum chinense]|nr:Delta(8)-fatty-acid desaturase [Capsicum chinense]
MAVCKYITAEELKKHNKREDLWVSVQGKVYNVTDWIKQHPGGDIPILNLAGQEATDAFIAFHPGTAWKYLDNFFTGYCLQDYEVSEISYLGHDSGHYVIMTTRGFNKMVQILSGNCLTGISIAWWKWTHNAHHVACNSLDYDPDLQHLPVFAVSPNLFKSLNSMFYGRELTFDSLAKFFVSYQHFTFYPIVCISRVNLFVQTLLLLFSKRKVPDRFLNILGILIFWTWFPLLVSTLPNGTERVLFVLTSFAVTGIQHVQFCLNHFAADVYVGQPKGNDWFEKQTAGTIDIDCSPQMDWFFGGLQFQLEHHLFPRLPRCQLRKISPIVQELCKKHNLPYRSLSFYEANKWTIRTLKVAAMQARGLLWEAVNTHG